jgi:hypothetical protein
VLARKRVAGKLAMPKTTQGGMTVKGADMVYMGKPMTCETKRGCSTDVSAHVNAEMAMAEMHPAKM